MPNYTANYKLKKPIPTELYDIEIHNDNMDVVDTELKKVSTVANSAESRSKINESTLTALKSYQADPFKETGGVVRVDLFQDAPLNVISKIEPLRKGKGDPYVAGEGRNKLALGAVSNVTWNGITYSDNGDGTITVAGTATDLSYLNIPATVPSGEFIFNGCPSGGATNGYFIKLVLADETTYDEVGNGIRITISEPQEITVRIVVRKNKEMGSLIFKPMIRLASDNDSTFAPYSNIRTIIGRTNARLTRSGKNLHPYPYGFSATIENHYGLNVVTNADGSITFTGTVTNDTQNGYATFSLISDARKFLLPVGKYNISGVPSGGGANRYRINVRTFTLDGVQIENRGDLGSGGWFEVTEDTAYIDAYLSIAEGINATGLVFKPMIVPDGEDTAYEPPMLNVYTANFDEPIYGGSIDWNTGVLTIDKGLKTYTGAEQFQFIYDENGVYRVGINLTGAKLGGECVCSHYKYALNGTSEANAMWVSESRPNVFFTSDKYTTMAEFQAFFAEQNEAGTPVQVVYELETPRIVSDWLTPRDIAALAGLNSVYSMTGNVTVSGRKDIIWLTHSLIKRIEALEAQVAGL